LKTGGITYFTHSLDPQFAPFLVAGSTWEKKIRASQFRGFVNDAHHVADENRRTREEKLSMPELMLGQIANYCSVILRSTIVKNSVSIDSIGKLYAFIMDSSPQVHIQVRQSPYIDALYTHHPIRLTIDSDATGNMIRASTAKGMCAIITASSQSAHQADGSSPLKVVGETRMVMICISRVWL
jgi:hypothetical protein